MNKDINRTEIDKNSLFLTNYGHTFSGFESSGLELDVQNVSNLLNEKFTYVELPISKTIRAIFQYTVIRGDTLFSISNKFNTNMKAIRAHNLMGTDDRLKIGQQIFIP